ncbi:MAG TPA: LysR substrate-binding domain-containing protein [Burkholderiales bacterium]|nr:LysR substrate-binding domain-containing protein [Burkholderiales bacterium]
MTLQQLRCLCAIVDESFNITRAAEKLHASQPGLSKQLRQLENELGFKLLMRRSNRTTGLTAAGHAVLSVARRMLKEAATMKDVLSALGDASTAQITIATTHVHARYSLLPVMKQFRKMHPSVRVTLRLGNAQQISYWVSTGEADLAIGSASAHSPRGLVSVPCFRVAHCVITPMRHPLLKLRHPGMQDIAKYPLISTGADSRLSALITARFASFGLQPDIVMHVLDIETVKKYVQLGFGIAIVPTIAVEAKFDRDLQMIGAGHLFAPTIDSVISQDDLSGRQHVEDFVNLVAPKRARGRAIRDLPATTAKQ